MKHRFYIVLLLTLVVFSSCTVDKKNIPKVEHGMLDLTNWDFDKDGAISIDGDWEFYWNKLYTPQDFKQDSTPLTGYCTVPGTWNQQEINHQYYPGKGFATYRIKIKTKHLNKILSFKLLDFSSSYNLFIDDQLIAADGVVSANPDSMKAQYTPMVKSFSQNSEEFQVIVQVANNFHNRGGIWNTILLGNQNQIMRIHERNYMYDLFLVGVMFILFIYHLWIYLFRHSEKTALGFGLLCFAIFIRTILTHERLLYVLFPWFDTYLGMKLEYITLIYAPYAGVYLYHYLFPLDFPKRNFRLITGITIAEMATVFFTQTDFYTSIVLVFQFILLLKAGYIIFVSVSSVVHKREGSVPFLISIIIIVTCTINDVLYANLIINTMSVVPYGFFVFILTQAYFLASRISQAFKAIELFSINLERRIVERTMQLQKEKDKSDELLLNILPAEVAEELKEKGSAEAKLINEVTVLFTDFKGFTQLSEKLSPQSLVAEINECFSAFDHIMQKHGVEKIKTIGDAYMAAGGLPTPNQTHAKDVILAALDIQQFMRKHKLKKEAAGEVFFEIRIGVHTGPVVAGIVGVKKYSYDIWGDTVNTANRMESSGEVGEVNISGSTYQQVKDQFNCIHRGKIEAKGKGEIEMYYVTKASAKDNFVSVIHDQMEFEKVKKFLLNKLSAELPGTLYYHSVEHVLDVMNAATILAEMEGVSHHEKNLLSTAALFHDSGFMFQNKDHEERSSEFAKVTLPDYGYSEEEIKAICGMIMATKIPQLPKTKLEEIICDADLDYLGRDDFWEIGNKLFMELTYIGIVNNENEWNKLQLGFLESHHYFTKSAIRSRQEKKEKHIQMIRNKITQ